jgi:hypothetical protein
MLEEWNDGKMEAWDGKIGREAEAVNIGVR